MDELSESDLRQFTGGDVRYRHAFNRAAIYTEGVQFLAERGGAYWLIDEIAIHLGSSAFREAAKHDERICLMHFWKLAEFVEDFMQSFRFGALWYWPIRKRQRFHHRCIWQA